MLIAQVTDMHLGFDPGNPAELNRKRFDHVLRQLIEGPNRPDLLLVTGDLTEHGDVDSYRRLANALGVCPFPVYPCLGNHDDRDNFARHFPQVPIASDFVQYCVELENLRMIVLDTLEPGRHGGGFCEARAAWLKARLAEQPDVPTVIVMHHPPFDAGIEWMATDPGEPWVDRFANTIAGQPQIQAVLCGHLHRAIVARWRGVSVTVCPSTAPQLALDLRPIDPDRPDNRTMVIADAPGYALHRWSNHGLVTLFDTAEDHVMLAKFDGGMQPLVRSLIDERPR